MLKLLILADDLTGANDAGVQLAEAGVRAMVLADWQAAALPQGCPAAVVNTDSRHVRPEEAARRVRHAAGLGLRAGAEAFYKKTDSTLRGNIGAELEALLRATGEIAMAFVPALPELGRTTRGGIHYVHGVPIAQTSFARDPLNPVRHSRVAGAVRMPGGARMAEARGPEGMAAEGITVLDCESQADLARIAGALAAAGRLRVAAGSVALARELPGHLGLPRQPRAEVLCRGRLLLVNGSVHERALEQIAGARDQLRPVRLAPGDLFGSGDPAAARLPVEGDVLLYSVARRDELSLYAAQAAAMGIPGPEIHARAAERTGAIVRAALEPFGTLAVFGGDTLAGIAQAAGWTAFEPLMELEPGISVTRPSGHGLVVISKAGAFGDAGVIARILGFARQGREPGRASSR